MPDTADTDPPQRSDAEMLARFQNAQRRPPCSELLGLHVDAVNQAEMRLSASFTATEAFTNPMGSVQGGFVAAMLDEAMSVCAIMASNITMTAPTLEMKISYLRPLFPGPVRVHAEVVKWGRSAAFLEAKLTDGEGKLVARASATTAPKPFKRIAPSGESSGHQSG